MQIIIYPSVKCAYLIYLENFNQPKNKSQYEICFHNVAQLITYRQQHYQHPWIDYIIQVLVELLYDTNSINIWLEIEEFFHLELQWNSCVTK